MKNLLIITGASSGIGLACIETFLSKENLHILAISRNASEITIQNNNLYKLNCDVTNYTQLETTLKEHLSNFKIVGLINAAGVVALGEFPSNHLDSQKMIDVNISGLTNCIEVILPIMRKQMCGTIINLSSLADRYPRPNNIVYAATKSYVKSISDSLRLQNAKYNIRVVNVAPALIETPMLTKQFGIKDNLINVNDFVKIIKFIFDQPQNICIRDIVIAPTNYEG